MRDLARMSLTRRNDTRDKGNSMVRDEGYDGWNNHYPLWVDRPTNSGAGVWRAPTELYGDRVRLRSLECGDEERLTHWANAGYERWPAAMDFVSVETLRRQVRAAPHGDEPLFIVEGKHSGRIVGWVYADQFSPGWLVCRMHVYIIPEARNYGAGAEATLLFLDYLFGSLGVRTVVIEPRDSQAYAIALARKVGFEVESAPRGELRLAIQRARWQETLLDGDACAPSCHTTSLLHSRHTGHIRQTCDVFLPCDEPPQRL